MSLVFCEDCDGFDYSTGTTDTGYQYVNKTGVMYSAYTSFQATGGRFGTGCMIRGGSNAGSQQLDWALVNRTPDDTGVAGLEHYFGFWLQSSAAYPSNIGGRLLRRYGSSVAGPNVMNSISPLGVGGNGILFAAQVGQFTGGAKTLAQGVRTVADGRWHWVEFAWRRNTALTASGAPNGRVALYVDGVLEFDYNNVMTTNYADSGLDRLNNVWSLAYMVSSATPVVNTLYDDIMLWNNQGTEFNTFPIGPQRLVRLAPAAASGVPQFVPNVNGQTNVQAVTQGWNRAKGVSSNGVSGAVDMYTTSGAANVSNIRGVTINQTGRAQKQNLTTRARIQVGATVRESADQTVTPADRNRQILFSQNQNNAQWSQSDINSLVIGYKAM